MSDLLLGFIIGVVVQGAISIASLLWLIHQTRKRLP